MIKNNLGQHVVDRMKATPPDKICYVDKNQKSSTYSDALKLIEHYQKSLNSLKQPPDVICLAPPGIHLLCLIIACFLTQKTVVFLDPQMGIQNFFSVCWKLKNVTIVYDKIPSFIIFLLKIIFQNLSFQKMQESNHSTQQMPLPNPNAIDGFTSGTTGSIKRIQRQHCHMLAAADIFSQNIIPLSEDLHLIGYTLSGIRNFIDQGTAFEKPKNSPLASFIQSQNISRISGPPSLFAEITQGNKTIFTSVQNIVIGGAPIQKWLAHQISNAFPNAQLQSVYGSTECEPICLSQISEHIQYQGLGYFVGKSVPELKCIYEKIETNLFELHVEGPQVTTGKRHNTKDLVRITENGSLVIVGRSDYILTTDHGHKLGQYEIETLLEKTFPEIKKAAALQKHHCLNVFIELFPGQHLQIKPVLKVVQSMNFHNVEIKIRHLEYDSRHKWKVLYHRL